ncbi:DNA repair protein RecN [Oceanivirga salmonicida]|uniref:DNA repair protein RecN n=1 Tax=Oceanivirga salmonicida TaxID=1769291 RepID=UPI0012E25613|nr:DNA repair protein RecN [Oceanivirga salmonicida]
MIRELKINNLAIIKDLEIDLETNFSVLTGETGAGKSIILDGISFLTGARSNVLAIRNGEKKLSVEAVIDLTDENIEKLQEITDTIDFSDKELIIYREIGIDSKSKIIVNDKRVTLSTLKNIMEQLVDIVGQHENQYLLNKTYHINLLDAFIDKKKYNLKSIVSDIKNLNVEIDRLEIEKKEILEKKDLYNFNIQEIDKLELYDGIDEELEAEYKLIFNSGRIKEAFARLVYELDENVLTGVKNCVRTINSISDVSTEISDINDRLEDIKEQLNDIYNDISCKDISEDNDTKLEEIADRLNKINKIKNKYKDSISNILIYKEQMQEKLSNIEYSSDKIEELKKLKDEKTNMYFENAKQLSKDRKEYAKKLEKEINNELYELNMKGASFKVNIDIKDGMHENGIDDIEFMIKANEGQEYNKLSKIASGGEISRIMLALKVVFSRVDNLSTLIFDEIDTGISGETVKLVAKKLRKLSKNIQVICVTHSPSIAIMADEQFLIEKTTDNSITETEIKKLNDEERIDEIARIISGDSITTALRNHIKEMMKGKNE